MGMGFFGGELPMFWNQLREGWTTVNTLKATGLDTLNGKTGVWIIAQQI